MVRILARILAKNLGKNLGRDLGKNLGRNLCKNLGKNPDMDFGKNVGMNLGKNLAIDLGKNLGRNLGKNLGKNLSRKCGCESWKEIWAGPLNLTSSPQSDRHALLSECLEPGYCNLCAGKNVLHQALTNKSWMGPDSRVSRKRRPKT